MNYKLNTLVRSNIRNLIPYSSARDEYTGGEAIYLDANENPFNAPQNRYPDPLQRSLKQKISILKEISSDQIFLGNGSDEAIDLLFRIFCEPGIDNVVLISPTYGMYQVCADINNIEVRKVLLEPDFSLNSDSLIQACDQQTKLLFICSPNNPTSNSFPREEILELAEKLNLIVVVDEAYIDFSERSSLIREIQDHPNLVILQTLSKAWGMAGIRLGMAMASTAIIKLMSSVKYPYNVNRLTIEYAIKALKDKEIKEMWVASILKERKTMVKNMKKFRFVQKIYPSDANFLLVKVKDPKQVYNYLVSRKIIVRDRSETPLCEGALRITIGTKEENAKLNKALMEYQRKFVENCET